MRTHLTMLAVFLGAMLFIPTSPAEGRDLISLRRIRIVSSLAEGSTSDEEMLEATFSLDFIGWVVELGWVLRYYDADKHLLGEGTVAYIDPHRNPMSRIRGRNFKGGTVFSLLFPLREEAAYLVLALGDRNEQKVALYPYTALLEDFNIPVSELTAAFDRSRLIPLED